MADNRGVLLGLRIMTLLHRQHKSVYALAKHAGLPLRTVQRICQGEGKQPSVWTIAAIARVLEVSLDDLAGWQENAQDTLRATRAPKDVHTAQLTTTRSRTRKATTAPADVELSLEAGYRALAAENRQLAEEALAAAAEILS